MFKIPDFKKAMEYENDFYLSCNKARIGKLLAHYELYKMASKAPGAIVECGVFKGVSFVRFAVFESLYGKKPHKKLIGFDTFSKFPETSFKPDIKYREKFIKAAGENSISRQQLEKVLRNKGIGENIEMIEGDILKTVPEYLRKNPSLKISLLNLDTDVYEPASVILENFYPRISKGGILVLDDYKIFPGETRAVDEYFINKNVSIKSFNHLTTPRFIVKSRSI